MKSVTHIDTDLIVQAFAYQARQLAAASASCTRTVLYEQILSEAEKHRSALRLAQRDIVEATAQALRKQMLNAAEAECLRESASRGIARALQAIGRIAAHYAPHKLAA
ncbi:hypothetical protein GCM10027343_02280 [Noviherbaspirillum agri]